MASVNGQEIKKATFAGGCFWCVESTFAKVPGVLSVYSGYSGGSAEDANYEKVSTGQSEHYEAIQIEYDPEATTYLKLLDSFWKEIDPTDGDGQFADRGPQYRPAIFYHDEEQRQIAEQSKLALEAAKIFEKDIVVAIIPYKNFFKAEDYHQDYYKKNPVHYNLYRIGSGREKFLESSCAIKPDRSEIKKKLSELQYHVTQEDGTERAFDNEYWNNKEPGIYVDVVTGEALFSSTDKYDSGTGWPSFTQPIKSKDLNYKTDHKLLTPRLEVRSVEGDSHLGHVFDDGPGPEGKRYCINSAALRFIPVDKLELEGYNEYKDLF